MRADDPAMPVKSRRRAAGTSAIATPVGSEVAAKLAAAAITKDNAAKVRVADRTTESSAARVSGEALPLSTTDLASDLTFANAPVIDPPVRAPAGIVPSQPASSAPAPSAPIASPEEGPSPETAAPRVTHFVAPVYPSGLGDRAVHGRVDLQFRIADDGSVQDVSVVSGDDHAQLARAAVSALRQWRFAPETAQAGHVYRQAIDFDLTAGNDTCRTPTGSHICRRDLGDAAGVTVIDR